MKNLYFVNSDDTVITLIFTTGVTLSIAKKDNPAHYATIKKAVLGNDWDQVKILTNPTSFVLDNLDNIRMEKDSIKINDIELPKQERKLTGLLDLVFRNNFKKDLSEDDINYIKPFIKNVINNPYINCVEEMYDYCKALDFQITPDGCFLAYKNVDKDYSSLHVNSTGEKTYNKIGTVVEETDVDTNRNNLCSKGLHFCSHSYLKHYPGAKTIVVKVNPMDVLAIPTDYNFAKGRCSKYEVISEIPKGRYLHEFVKEDENCKKLYEKDTYEKHENEDDEEEYNDYCGIGDCDCCEYGDEYGECHKYDHDDEDDEEDEDDFDAYYNKAADEDEDEDEETDEDDEEVEPSCYTCAYGPNCTCDRYCDEEFSEYIERSNEEPTRLTRSKFSINCDTCIYCGEECNDCKDRDKYKKLNCIDCMYDDTPTCKHCVNHSNFDRYMEDKDEDDGKKSCLTCRYATVQITEAPCNKCIDTFDKKFYIKRKN